MDSSCCKAKGYEMATIEGFRVKSFKVLKDVTLGRLWNQQQSRPLTPMTAVIGRNGVGESALFDAFGFLADALKSGVEEACDARGRGGFEKIRAQGEAGRIKALHVGKNVRNRALGDRFRLCRPDRRTVSLASAAATQAAVSTNNDLTGRAPHHAVRTRLPTPTIPPADWYIGLRLRLIRPTYSGFSRARECREDARPQGILELWILACAGMPPSGARAR